MIYFLDIFRLYSQILLIIFEIIDYGYWRESIFWWLFDIIELECIWYGLGYEYRVIDGWIEWFDVDNVVCIIWYRLE